MKRAFIFLVLGLILGPIVIILMMGWVGEYVAPFAIILSFCLLPVTVVAWALDEVLADALRFAIVPRVILIATVGALGASGLAFFIKPLAGDLLWFAAGGAISMGACSLLSARFRN